MTTFDYELIGVAVYFSGLVAFLVIDTQRKNAVDRIPAAHRDPVAIQKRDNHFSRGG